MEETRDESRAGGGERFAYFMVRIHGGPGADRVKPSGIVERLGSGRKDAFSGAEELVRLLSDVSDGDSNMGTDKEISNAGKL
jgi:hypothetical protein